MPIFDMKNQRLKSLSRVTVDGIIPVLGGDN